MPTDNTTAPTTALTDISSIQAAAAAQYEAKVVKELTTKMSVIAKRKSQLAAFNDRMTALFAEFETDLAAAGNNPAKVKEVLEAHKFPASVMHFTPRQDD